MEVLKIVPSSFNSKLLIFIYTKLKQKLSLKDYSVQNKEKVHTIGINSTSPTYIYQIEYFVNQSY